MNAIKVGVAITGSFCTHETILNEIKNLVSKGYDVTAIISYEVANIDTRFGKASDFEKALKEITGKSVIKTLVGAEPIGPKAMFDILVVAPCTGSTLSRLASGLSSTPVSLAVKSHLRGKRPVLLGIATNDGLGASMRNIAMLINNKYIYFVPLSQDDAINKENSLVADFSNLEESIKSALQGEQLQPVFIK